MHINTILCSFHDRLCLISFDFSLLLLLLPLIARMLGWNRSAERKKKSNLIIFYFFCFFWYINLNTINLLISEPIPSIKKKYLYLKMHKICDRFSHLIWNWLNGKRKYFLRNVETMSKEHKTIQLAFSVEYSLCTQMIFATLVRKIHGNNWAGLAQCRKYMKAANEMEQEKEKKEEKKHSWNIRNDYSILFVNQFLCVKRMNAGNGKITISNKEFILKWRHLNQNLYNFKFIRFFFFFFFSSSISYRKWL